MQKHRTDQRAPRQGTWLAEVEPIAPVDLVGVLWIIWHGKWLILASFLLSVGLAGYHAFRLAQPQYEATATLALDPAPAGFGTGAAQSAIMVSDEVRLNTALAALTSREVLTGVIADLDLMSDPEFNRYLNPVPRYGPQSLRRTLRHLLSGTTDTPPTDADMADKAIENLRGHLQVAARPDTFILQIKARSASAQKAAQIATTTTQFFLTAQERAQTKAGEAAAQWLNAQLETLEGQLALKEDHISGLIASAQLQDDSEIDALSIQVLQADQLLAQLDAELAALTGRAQGDSGRWQAERAQKQDAIAAASALRARLSAQLLVQSSGLAHLQQLQHEADGIRSTYAGFLARLHDLRAQQELRTPIAQRLTGATPGHYIGPQKILILTIAAVVGTIAGLLLVAVRHALRQGVMDAAALRDATNTPVLAQFPKAANGSDRQLRKYLRSDRQSVLADAVRSLRTSLLLTNHGHVPQVILSTSSVDGEGHTTQAIGLADALGRAGKSVLLVGADPAGQVLLPFLSVKPRHNMLDIFSGTVSVDAVIIRDTTFSADALQATGRDDQADVFLSEAFGALLQKLRQDYDHIIIAGPPVLTAPQTRLMAQQADAVIYAVSQAKTPLALVKRGLRALEEADAPATGLVLSNIKAGKLLRMGHGPVVGSHGFPVPV